LQSLPISAHANPKLRQRSEQRIWSLPLGRERLRACGPRNVVSGVSLVSARDQNRAGGKRQAERSRPRRGPTSSGARPIQRATTRRWSSHAIERRYGPLQILGPSMPPDLKSTSRRMPIGSVHPHAAISGGQPIRSSVAKPRENRSRWPFCTNQVLPEHRP
jgi:hypothetical protein